MAHVKRTTVIVAGAMIALTACAPAGYNGANTGAAEPVAVAAAEPTGDAEPEAAATPGAPATDKAAAPAGDVQLTDQLVGKKLPRMGKVVTDQDGWVLYRFDKDSADPPQSNCVDKCAQVWPPALTDGNPRLQGVSDDKVGTVTRQDGTRQITIGGWPVYRYIGDKKPGQWKGQGVGGTWFVVDPNGKKNLTCLPKGTPKAVAPPASGTSSGGGSNYSY
ncbi:lipoprotein [Micromonospora sp. HK10]|uniref:lipoprotein n=1 Tax=Micromonospora sp. HK10 TaxID=1538294 RepID=UPI000626EFBD|nr:lipoprotein [Micromonospora sp. HK10]KKK07357.1 lipoprotein [Micromonospora sp. HK10]